MLRAFEGLSTWILRIAAISVLVIVTHEIIREQSRPAKVDLQDAKYLERMEEFIKREKACGAAANLSESGRAIQPTQRSGKRIF